MKLFIILGNQLFPPKYIDRYKNDHLIYMAEDQELCTYERHHKLKILLFLSSMRSYADRLKKEKFKVNYSKIDSKDFTTSYTIKLKKLILTENIKEISSFEIEDKYFEEKFKLLFKKLKIKWNIIQTPMFLNSRNEFKNYLKKSKKPFMATFYKDVRKKSGILMGSDGNPIGGKWSFDEDNRNKLPKNISIPKFPKINETNHTKKLKPIIEKLFKDHPGKTDNFWFATEYNDVIKLLNFFIKEKSNLFGDYEDAVNQKDNITATDLGLTFVDKLTPKSYKFKGKTRTHYGLIAQDVEAVLSDISKSASDFAGFIKDKDSDNNDIYGLRYTEFIAPLIKAIQELSAKVTALEAK